MIHGIPEISRAYTTGQIINKLREAELLLGQDATAGEVRKKDMLGIIRWDKNRAGQKAEKVRERVRLPASSL